MFGHEALQPILMIPKLQVPPFLLRRLKRPLTGGARRRATALLAELFLRPEGFIRRAVPPSIHRLFELPLKLREDVLDRLLVAGLRGPDKVVVLDAKHLPQ